MLAIERYTISLPVFSMEFVNEMWCMVYLITQEPEKVNDAEALRSLKL